jgi:hypothetical protein
MPSTYTTNLGIELPADGELDGVWGDVVNENMDILDRAINGSVALTLSGTTSTLTTSDGALSDGQYKLLVLGGTPSGTHTITIAPSDAQKIYFVRNTTAQSVVFTQGSGGNVTIATGDSAIIYSDGAGAGAAVVNITNDFAMSSVKITGGTIDGTVIGGSSAAAGTFTTATATTGNITTVNATTVDTTNLEVTTLKAKDGTAAGSIADSTGVVTLASSVLTTTDINGGTIDGTTIGGASAAAGTFTTAAATTGNITTVNATTVDSTNLEVTNIKAKDGTSAGSIADSTGVVTLASSVLTTTDINGGTVDGAVIGGSSAAAITGTTITATGDVTIADKIIHAGDTDTAIRFPAADTVTVETAGSERLRVDSSGNVGIGTSSPGHRLDVSAGQATVKIGSSTTSAGNEPAILLEHAGNNTFQIKGGADLIFSSDAGTNERMRITTAGNVGIGTSSPSYKLDVRNGVIASGNGTIFGGISYSTRVEMGAISNHNLGFITNNDTKMILDTSGNLGLGVTPSAWAAGTYKGLEVSAGGAASVNLVGGDASLMSNAYISAIGTSRYLFSSVGASKYQFYNSSHSWFTAPSGTAGNAITFTQAMTLSAGGNLLVGTTNDSARLHVFDGSAASSTATTSVLFSRNGVNAGEKSTAIQFDVGGGGGQARIYTERLAGLGGNLIFAPADTSGNFPEAARIDASGNVLIGGTATPASATASLAIFNGSAPTGSVTNGVVLYAEDVSSSSELKVRDEAGNVTTLSPHNFDLIPEGPSEDMAWSYYSERDGKRINVDMLKAIRLLESITGEKLVHIV